MMLAAMVGTCFCDLRCRSRRGSLGALTVVAAATTRVSRRLCVMSTLKINSYLHPSHVHTPPNLTFLSAKEAPSVHGGARYRVVLSASLVRGCFSASTMPRMTRSPRLPRWNRPHAPGGATSSMILTRRRGRLEGNDVLVVQIKLNLLGCKVSIYACTWCDAATQFNLCCSPLDGFPMFLCHHRPGHQNSEFVKM